LAEGDADFPGRWRAIKKGFSKSVRIGEPRSPVMARRFSPMHRSNFDSSSESFGHEPSQERAFLVSIVARHRGHLAFFSSLLEDMMGPFRYRELVAELREQERTLE